MVVEFERSKKTNLWGSLWKDSGFNQNCVFCPFKHHFFNTTLEEIIKLRGKDEKQEVKIKELEGQEKVFQQQ